MDLLNIGDFDVDVKEKRIYNSEGELPVELQSHRCVVLPDPAFFAVCQFTGVAYRGLGWQSCH